MRQTICKPENNTVKLLCLELFLLWKILGLHCLEFEKYDPSIVILS